MYSYIDKLTNAYVEIQPIHSFDIFEENLSKYHPGFVYSNCPYNHNKFFEDLAAYEEEFGYKYEKYQKRLAISMKVLLPFNLKEEDYAVFAAKFMKRLYNKMSYYCLSLKQGKGKYLLFVISERLYSEKGFVIEKRAKSDCYKDSKTGKLCKSDHPNAICVTHKGDILSTSTSLYSKKVNYFAVPKDRFLLFISKIKSFINEVLLDLRLHQEAGFSFQKVNWNNYDHKYMANVKLINKTIYSMDQDLTTLYQNMLSGYMFYHEADTAFNNFILRYTQRLHNLSFKLKRLSFTLSPNTTDQRRLSENLATFYSIFIDDLQKFGKEELGWI